MVQNFRENAKNHMNVNFRDKNFMIAKFFRDYLRTAAPALTLSLRPQFLHVVLGLVSVKRNESK